MGQGLQDLTVIDGKIAAIGAADPSFESVDVEGYYLLPAFIDSHVHLAYLPQAAELAAGGIVAAVDMAAPLDFLAHPPALPHLLLSGPMITAPAGYPTQGWGQNGYGLECANQTEAIQAVDRLASAGAKLIKLPLAGAPELDASTRAAVVQEAHRLGLKVASHALTDTAVQEAAAANIDILAHTPTSLLSEASLQAWAGKAVVSTLAAFGGSPSAQANLLALTQQGARLLYGTDFGNTRNLGIDPNEISLLQSAGFSAEAILAAGTTSPASYWGFTDLGSIAPQKEASLLILETDPRLHPETLATPVAVILAGKWQNLH